MTTDDGQKPRRRSGRLVGSMVAGAWISVRSRLIQIARIVKAGGASGVWHRIIRVGHRLLGEQHPELPLDAQDIADSMRLASPERPLAPPAQPLRVAWITTPPGAGSGGHTTMLRMVEGLERAGHATSLYLYDIYHGDAARHERVIRSNWPNVRAAVHDVRHGFAEADVWIATSWQTAHVLACRPELRGHRMYFVQDYEPYFYARGALYALAEDTYRFGFTGITAGAWLSTELSLRFGMTCHHFEFGADTDIYSPALGTPRNGVVFYSKRGVPRRGHELGVLALERFYRSHPEALIHLFGDPPGEIRFDATNHGRLSPTSLNDLYNSCRVGLSLSFTNISLIPWELLASGVVPVVNDAPHNRLVLHNDHVAWAAPTPGTLADAMCEAWDAYHPESTPITLARSVRGAKWEDAARSVTDFIERIALA